MWRNLDALCRRSAVGHCADREFQRGIGLQWTVHHAGRGLCPALPLSNSDLHRPQEQRQRRVWWQCGAAGLFYPVGSAEHDQLLDSTGDGTHFCAYFGAVMKPRFFMIMSKERGQAMV